jgi:hypothetical protein
VDHYSDRSTVDSRPGQGGTLAGTWRAAATEGGSSRRKHLEKDATEGNLTVGEGGQHGGGARPATRSRGGGGGSSTAMVFESRRMENEGRIIAGYGVGAHSAFYRAGEEGSGGDRGVTGGGSMELQGATVSTMKWGD